jgi:hypothetical protein
VVSASDTNCRSPVAFRAAAGAAKKKRVSGQYATAEIGHAASEPQKVEQLRAAGVVRAAKEAVVGRGSAKLQVKVKVRVQCP